MQHMIRLVQKGTGCVALVDETTACLLGNDWVRDDTPAPAEPEATEESEAPAEEADTDEVEAPEAEATPTTKRRTGKRRTTDTTTETW